MANALFVQVFHRQISDKDQIPDSTYSRPQHKVQEYLDIIEVL